MKVPHRRLINRTDGRGGRPFTTVHEVAAHHFPPDELTGSVSNATTLPIVQSNSRYQSASLVVQQQNLIDGVDFVFRQTNACGCHVLDDVGDLGGSRNWQNDWGSCEQPCQRDL